MGTDAENWLQTTYPELFQDWREAYLKPVRQEKVSNPDCRICQLRLNTGLHYGIYTCEADKQFLKRTFHDKFVYKICTLGCPPRLRGWCQYCRLKSSLMVGINLKMIRIGDKQKKVEKSPRTKPSKKNEDAFKDAFSLVKKEPCIKEEKPDESWISYSTLVQTGNEKMYENYPLQQGFGTYLSCEEQDRGFRSYSIPQQHVEHCHPFYHPTPSMLSQSNQGFRTHLPVQQERFRAYSPENASYQELNSYSKSEFDYPQKHPVQPTPVYQTEYIQNFWEQQLYPSLTEKWIHEHKSVSPIVSKFNDSGMFNLTQSAPLDLSSSSSSSSRPPSRPNSADSFSGRSSPRSRRVSGISDVGTSFNKLSVNSTVLQAALTLVQGSLSPGNLRNISHVSDVLSE